MKVEISTITEGPYKGEKLVGVSGVKQSGKSLFLSHEQAQRLVFKLLTVVTWERDKGFFYDELSMDKILVPRQRGEQIEIYGFSPKAGAHWCRLDEAYVLAMDMLQLLMFGVGIYVDEDYRDY